MYGIERRQDQDIRPDRHALRMCRDIAHDGRDLQHLHRMGQPVMREPKGRETGVTRRAHLCDHLRDAFREVEACRELRVDEQTDLTDCPLEGGGFEPSVPRMRPSPPWPLNLLQL